MILRRGLTKGAHNDEKILAVVTLSGGMDSCVTLAHALDEGCEVALLHADYGQRTESRERKAFQEIAKHYQIPTHRQLVVPLGHLSLIGGSSLIDVKEEIPEGDLHRQGVPRPTSLSVTHIY